MTMVASSYANAKDVSPMKYAIEHSDHFGNRTAFRFKKWFHIGTVSEAKTCEYMVHRFKSLEGSSTKRAARKAVECAEFALALKESLKSGENAFARVELVSPLNPEFYARIAVQCAKGASIKSEQGIFFLAKAASYNEMAAKEYEKKGDRKNVVEQLELAVKNCEQYFSGLETLSRKESSSSTIVIDIGKAKDQLAYLKKELALAQAHRLEAKDVGFDSVRRGDNYVETARLYLEAGEIEKSVENLIKAGNEYSIEVKSANDDGKIVAASSAYQWARTAFNQAMSLAGTTTGPGSLDKALSEKLKSKIRVAEKSLTPPIEKRGS